MPIVISDEFLKQANLSERDALIEIACRLYDAGRLTFRQADLLAGLSRNEMEEELRQRGLAVYRYTQEMLDQDLATLRLLDRLDQRGGDEDTTRRE